jgi:hypothetical protein
MIHFNSNLPEDLRRKLEGKMNSPEGDFAKTFNKIQSHMENYNRTPQAELQGYSPAMCDALRYEWNTPESPIQFNAELTLAQLTGIHIFDNVRTVLRAVHEAGGVKATVAGNFNRKFVESMVDPLLDAKAKEELLTYHKVLNEPGLWPLHEARIIATAAGLLVKRKGMLNVTQKHLALLDDAAAGQLFVRLFGAFFRKYNIGYRHNYGIDIDWLQHEIRFILYPLSLKAKKWIDVADLAQELLHPMVLDDLQKQLSTQSFLTESNAMIRYFVQPLHDWGMLDIQWSDDRHFRQPNRIRLSPRFSKFIRFNPDYVIG